MSNSWKTFTVRFCSRDYYQIDVEARSEDEAIAKATDLYDRHGADTNHGFVFDLSDGGTDDWEAEPVSESPSTNESTHHG